MNWYLTVLKKYAEFNGRARRAEYWTFVLINAAICWGLMILGMVTGLKFLAILCNLYSLAVLVPSIAVGVRRMHDTGRSGWTILVNLIPVIGWIIFIVFAAQEGTRGDNQYGADPKAAA